MDDSTERHWQRLAEDWQSAGPTLGASLELARQTRVATRRQWARFALALAVSLALAAVLFHLRRVHPTQAAERWTALGLGNLVALWGFLLLNRIGTWRAYGTTSESFLALSERRARRALWAAWIVGVGLTAELLLIVIWMASEGMLSSGAGFEEWTFRLTVLALVLATVVVCVVAGSRAHAELERLVRLRREG